jgi:hypothetical protein
LPPSRISKDPAEHGVAVRKTRFRRSRVGFGSVAGADIVKKRKKVANWCLSPRRQQVHMITILKF